jgi:hypothetical protein
MSMHPINSGLLPLVPKLFQMTLHLLPPNGCLLSRKSAFSTDCWKTTFRSRTSCCVSYLLHLYPYIMLLVLNRRMKAIIITGAGYPDMATRALVKKMSLKFPVCVPIAQLVACIYLLVIISRDNSFWCFTTFYRA